MTSLMLKKLSACISLMFFLFHCREPNSFDSGAENSASASENSNNSSVLPSSDCEQYALELSSDSSLSSTSINNYMLMLSQQINKDKSEIERIEFSNNLLRSITFTDGSDVIIPTINNHRYEGGRGNDRYILSPHTIEDNAQIEINDTQGENQLQIDKDLEIITITKDNQDNINIEFSNNSIVTVFGAKTFSYDIEGNKLTQTKGVQKQYDDFMTEHKEKTSTTKDLPLTTIESSDDVCDIEITESRYQQLQLIEGATYTIRLKDGSEQIIVFNTN